MSSVTIITKYKGVYKKGVAHYAQLYLDVQKRFKTEMRWAEDSMKKSKEYTRAMQDVFNDYFGKTRKDLSQKNLSR